MIYQVNTKRINQQLKYLEKCLRLCEGFREKRTPLTEVEEFALARALQIAVECIIDTGSVMIDGFIMRDPGGYQDIIDILEDEKVISRNLASTLRNWVKLREGLVRHYVEVKQSELMSAIKEAPTVFRFIHSVNLYLANELQ